ncbi:MAG: aspartyl/glutamyl-tRNA(Asn/Gln) amidotransferase subunit C [Candidatus Micrarchaeota archaeon]|nr:MAG: aspartyl/glutamyl-tRNA(Asn/Gln) amidotransferase subunit C [Candidatus Micrarchaeota archaeon]
MKILIDDALIDKLAKLSRIALTEDEKKLFKEQLNAVIDAFNIIDELDNQIKDIEPAFHPIEIADRFRDDIPEEYSWNPLEQNLNNENDYIKANRTVR